MPDDQPHYEFTCDAGECDEVTAAIVLGVNGWLSMCRTHAIKALGALNRDEVKPGMCCGWHSPTCEYPGEICCWECSEIHHGVHTCDGLQHESHHDGSRCVLDA
jgi:hypothetical protein